MTRGSRLDTAQPPRKIGRFYPRGYVMVAFKSEDEAARVRQHLIDGGGAQRLMDVCRRQGHPIAQKYNRFSFTEL